MTRPQIQPCTDPDCGVHGRGADPGAHEATCARQILRAYDRPGAVALLDRQPVESLEFGEERSVIPLSSVMIPRIVVTTVRDAPPPPSPVAESNIEPGQCHTILVQANHVRSFRPEHLYLSRAGTENGAADWVVNDIVLDGRSQIAPHRDLPGALFGTQVVGGLRTFDRISGEAPIEVTVTYVGARPTPFFASLIGVTTRDRRSIKLGGGRFATGDVRELTAKAEHAMDAFRVLIQGPAHNLIVRDIKFSGVSQFSQAGDIPGDMFGTKAIDGFVSFKTIEVGDEVTVVVQCVDDIDEEPIECAIIGQEPRSRMAISA